MSQRPPNTRGLGVGESLATPQPPTRSETLAAPGAGGPPVRSPSASVGAVPNQFPNLVTHRGVVRSGTTPVGGWGSPQPWRPNVGCWRPSGWIRPQTEALRPNPFPNPFPNPQVTA